jgi:hypothetical protein
VRCGPGRSALRTARVLTPFGGRDVEELEFRGVEDGREGRAVEALKGRGRNWVGCVDPGRAVVAVAFLQEGREDRPVVPVGWVGDAMPLTLCQFSGSFGQNGLSRVLARMR